MSKVLLSPPPPGSKTVARRLRVESFDPNEVKIFRRIDNLGCVLLGGEDPISGKKYEFRREWIRAWLECLALVFGLNVLAYGILTNQKLVTM
jgi:hypothetical protein